MSTIQKIDRLTAIAEQLGYQVRYDYFGGTGGGTCEFAGKKILFMDLALTSAEQLERLEETLARDPLLSTSLATKLPEPTEINDRRAA